MRAINVFQVAMPKISSLSINIAKLKIGDETCEHVPIRNVDFVGKGTQQWKRFKQPPQGAQFVHNKKPPVAEITIINSGNQNSRLYLQPDTDRSRRQFENMCDRYPDFDVFYLYNPKPRNGRKRKFFKGETYLAITHDGRSVNVTIEAMQKLMHADGSDRSWQQERAEQLVAVHVQ